VLTSPATTTEKLKNGSQARAHAEPIYETNYFDDEYAYRIRMRKPQRSPPQIRSTISWVAAASGHNPFWDAK
jgi:hypothetical protein